MGDRTGAQDEFTIIYYIVLDAIEKLDRGLDYVGIKSETIDTDEEDFVVGDVNEEDTVREEVVGGEYYWNKEIE